MSNAFDLEEVRADIDYASNGIDGPDTPHHPHALAALSAARKLLAEVETQRANATSDQPRTFTLRTFEVPTIPADVTQLRDKTGRIWTAINVNGRRTWRFMTLRFTDGSLLASIYGPTFTEVTTDETPVTPPATEPAA